MSSLCCGPIQVSTSNVVCLIHSYLYYTHIDLFKPLYSDANPGGVFGGHMVLALQKPGLSNVFTVLRPNTGLLQSSSALQ